MGTPMEELRKMLDLQIELNKSLKQSNLELLNDLETVKNELNEAKEKEKQVIIEAYKQGIDDYVDIKKQSNSEQYYKETFNQ